MHNINLKELGKDILIYGTAFGVWAILNAAFAMKLTGN